MEVREEPAMFPNFTINNDQVYRLTFYQTNDEENAPWKLCVSKYLKSRVLKESHKRIFSR